MKVKSQNIALEGFNRIQETVMRLKLEKRTLPPGDITISLSQDIIDGHVKPQEHGNHYNTKYLKLGKYIFESNKGFEFNVSEYSKEELERKKHNFELATDEFTNVRIDYKVSGIGSGSCGPQLLEKYQLNDKNIIFNFTIKREIN